MKRDYKDPEYRKWRRKVYKRDNYTCQMPGCDSKRAIQAHHIRRWVDFPQLRFDVNNGITLCKKCHTKITGCEYNYITIFLEAISKNKERTKSTFLKIRKWMLGDVQDNT